MVPAEATAVVVNVTAVRPTVDTFVTARRDLTSPSTSTVNVVRGEVTANLATVAVDQAFRSIAVMNNSGSVDVLVDLLGYYSPAEGAAFHPVVGDRVFDSRGSERLSPGSSRHVGFAPLVPWDATAILVNLTGLADGTDTYLTPFAGQSRPSTSTLNLRAWQTAANQAVVGVGTPEFDVYNHAGFPHAVVDLFGYFAPREG
jgi:hypothetical protein